MEKKDRSRTRPDKEKSVKEEHVGEELEEEEEYAPDYESWREAWRKWLNLLYTPYE